EHALGHGPRGELPGAWPGDGPAVHGGGVEGGQVGERGQRGGQGVVACLCQRDGAGGRPPAHGVVGAGTGLGPPGAAGEGVGGGARAGGGPRGPPPRGAGGPRGGGGGS